MEINEVKIHKWRGSFGLIYDRESGCVRKGVGEFTGVVYRTNNERCSRL